MTRKKQLAVPGDELIRLFQEDGGRPVAALVGPCQASAETVRGHLKYLGALRPSGRTVPIEEQQSEHHAKHAGLLALCGALMLTHAVRLFGVRVMAANNSLNGWLQLACVAGIVGTLTFLPSHHQSVGFVLGHYTNTTGWTSAIIADGIGLLFSTYPQAGFDTSRRGPPAPL